MTTKPASEAKFLVRLPDRSYSTYIASYEQFCNEHGLDRYDVIWAFGTDGGMKFGFDDEGMAILFKLMYG